MEKVKTRDEYMEKVHYSAWLKDLDPTTGVLTGYVKNLCEFIKGKIPAGEKILDVGVCKGYPFAAFFDRMGYRVYGLDISKELVGECVRRFPNIKCKIGNAQNIEFEDNFFHAAYCFNSSWYFSDFFKAFDEMLRVTKPGGFVILDVQNMNNPEIGRAYRKALSETRFPGKIVRIIKNIVKAVLRRKYIDWNFVVYVTPAEPEKIYRFIGEKYGYKFSVMGRNPDDSLKKFEGCGAFSEFARLIFVIEKSPIF